MIEKSGQRLRLNLRQLEVFVAIARTGSARAAADRVARSQSAASSALAELESVLAVALFDRIGRRLVLNENGRALLPVAAALLEQAADLEDLLRGEHAAALRIAASLTIGEYLLPPLLARWKQQHPHSRVRMMIGNTSEVIAHVVGNDADVGFIEGSQTHPDLRVLSWRGDDLVIVAAPGHALAGKVAGARQLSCASWICVSWARERDRPPTTGCLVSSEPSMWSSSSTARKRSSGWPWPEPGWRACLGIRWQSRSTRVCWSRCAPDFRRRGATWPSWLAVTSAWVGRPRRSLRIAPWWRTGPERCAAPPPSKLSAQPAGRRYPAEYRRRMDHSPNTTTQLRPRRLAA